MNHLLVIFFSLLTSFSFCQSEAKVKRITVEQSFQHPSENDFHRVEVKEFDKNGNEVVLKVFDKNSGKERNRVETTYDSLNRVILMNCYDGRPIRNGLWQTIDYTYQQDTVTKCSWGFGSGDTVRHCEISVKKYDQHGSIYSTQVEKTNPNLLNIRDEMDPKKNRGYYKRTIHYSSDYHRYTYDSLGRIVSDTNRYVENYRGTYRISTIHYRNGKRYLYRVEYPEKWDTLDGPVDTLFYNQIDTYHPNGTVASTNIHKYSKLKGKKLDERVYFEYDSYGNKVEYAIKTHGPDGKKASWKERYSYTYDDKGRVLTLVINRPGSNNKGANEYFRYVYEEW